MINKQCNAGDPLEPREAYTEDHLLCKYNKKMCMWNIKSSAMFDYYE